MLGIVLKGIFKTLSNIYGEVFLQNIFDQFQPSVTFHMENNHLICRAKEITRFYINRNIGLK